MAHRLHVAWLTFALMPALGACVVENEPSGGTVYDPAPAVTTPPTAPGPSTVPATNEQPILVDVDTNQVLTASGGGGVGVFVEYKAGGHWHVYWTCDTLVNPTGPGSCNFDVKITPTAGTMVNIVPQGAVNALSNTPTQYEAQSLVHAEVDGLTFDTGPGAVLTIDATVEGTRDGRLFFFVQNNVVNGNVDASKLSDPMMFVGSSP